MQRNIWTRPRVRSWRQIIGIRFTWHHKHGDRNFLGHFVFRGEPLCIRPGLDYLFGRFITSVGFFFDIVKSIEHQQRVRQGCGGFVSQFRIVQRLDQRLNIVATQHGAQNFHRTLI